MRRDRRLPFWIGVLLVVFYAVRAISGIVGGVAYARGSALAGEGDFRGAVGYLEWAIAPDDPAALHWLRGQVRQGIWGMITDEIGRNARTDAQLIDAHHQYTLAISRSPSSGWYWADLAELYQKLDLMERAEQPFSLGGMDESPWSRVGVPGRVAIGMCRIGIAREPNVYVLHDRLATLLFEDQLDELALDAVRASAEIQPIYYLHPYRDLDPVPDGLLDVFAEGSRSGLGTTPLMGRAVHLTALGRVELQRGQLAQAVADLREALEYPGHRLNRAEANFYLGSALLEQGLFDEAREKLDAAREHPNMETRTLGTLILLEERAGDLERALALVGDLRKEEPRNLGPILSYARLARRLERWDQAEDALRWGILTHPGESRPLVALIELYLEQGDLIRAKRSLTELAQTNDGAPEVLRLQARIDAASSRGS